MYKTLSRKMFEEAFNHVLDPQQAEEKLREIYNLSTKAKDQAFREKIAKENIKKMYMGKHFVTQRLDVENIYAQLNLAEAGAFYRILSFMQLGRSGLLVKDNRTMKLKDFEEIIGLSSSQTKATIKKLVNVGLINKNGGKKNQTYSINQDHCFIGTAPDGKTEPFTKLFKVVAKEWISPRLTLAQQGFLLKLTPYINFQTHFIAENPMEKVITNVTPMSLDSIAANFGLSTKTVRTHIKALGRIGILKDIGDAGSTMSDRMFFLNPQAAQRGKIGTKQFLDVQSMFEDLHKNMKEHSYKEMKDFIHRVGVQQQQQQQHK